METRHLAQLTVDWCWRRPWLQFAACASHQGQAAGIHRVCLGLDALGLTETAGLVGKHHVDRLPDLVEMVGQRLVIDACRLHEVGQREALSSF